MNIIKIEITSVLNQRLFAAFLAVTTLTTTVAVNVSPSYGQIRPIIRNGVKLCPKIEQCKNYVRNRYQELNPKVYEQQRKLQQLRQQQQRQYQQQPYQQPRY